MTAAVHASHVFPPLMHPGLLGWFHVLFIGVWIPLRVAQKRHSFLPKDGPLPDRAKFFRVTMIALTFLTGFSVFVAWREGVLLFPTAWPPWYACVVGVMFYFVAVVFMRPRWRKAVVERRRVVHLFMPQTGAERVSWMVVSTMAGVGEEITWRGVQFALIGGITGDAWSAAVLTSISFGVGHMIQGWKSSALIGLFALGFHGLVWLSGSLYVAMGVHVAYDITAGLLYGKYGRELGYSSTAPPPLITPAES